MSVSSSRTILLSILSIVLIGCVLYANTLNVPFYFDDSDNIKNPALRINEITLDQITAAVSEGTLKKRPVSNVSFAFNYYFGGFKVQGYHVVNILVHVLSGIFLFLLLSVTLNLPVNREKYSRFSSLAYVAALLWLVHPLATQSVTYIVQRMNSMASMFYVLSLLLYVMGRNRQMRAERRQEPLPAWVWFLASLFSGLLAIGSKEIAATLPFMVLLYEWYFIQDLSFEWIRKKVAWLAGAIFFLGLLSFFYLGSNPWRIFFSDCPTRDFTSFERLLTQFRVVVHYISLLIYPNPNRLVFDYNFPVSTSLFSPVTTLYTFIGIIVLVLFAVLLARRERLLSFCILWFLGNMVIESSVICLEIIFEHRTYLPSMFFPLFLTAVVYRLGRSNTIVTLILVPVIVLFGYWTLQRNKVWQNPVMFWSSSVNKYPGKARSHSNLGIALYRENKVGKAAEEFSRAIQLKTAFPEAFNNLAICERDLGSNKKAEQYYREAIRLRPKYVEARINFGVLLESTGRAEEAAEQYSEAIKISPGYPPLEIAYGRLLLREGNLSQAITHLKSALFWRPEDPDLLLDIGEGLIRLGKNDEAIAKFRKVIDLNPELAGAHYNLAMLLLEKGEAGEALRHYRLATGLSTSHVPLLYNFANLLYRLGNNAEAEKYYKQFIQLTPELADTYNNYGLILMGEGEFAEAARQFETAVRIMPGNPVATRNLMLVKEIITESRKTVEPAFD